MTQLNILNNSRKSIERDEFATKGRWTREIWQMLQKKQISENLKKTSEIRAGKPLSKLCSKPFFVFGVLTVTRLQHLKSFVGQIQKFLKIAKIFDIQILKHIPHCLYKLCSNIFSKTRGDPLAVQVS